jgi:SAM-dependent methyltransferase
MGFYNNVILPPLCDLAMRNKHMLPYRQRVIGAAEGRVLEIGIGSGLNLPFYRNSGEIIGLEPAPRLIAMARQAAETTSTQVTLIEGSASAIPIDDRSIDAAWCLRPQVQDWRERWSRSTRKSRRSSAESQWRRRGRC